MKTWLTYLLFICLSLTLPGMVWAEDDDDGTDEDGRVIWSETLADRCNLSSRKADMGDCYKKLASDYKLGKTPSGDSYEIERNQILHEQIAGYLTTSLQRLVNNSTHHDDLYNSQGEGAAGPNPSKDTRDVVEKIGKSTQMNFESTSDVVDSMSLKNLTYQYETLYTVVVPEIATHQMTQEEAEAPDLRKDKVHQ